MEELHINEHNADMGGTLKPPLWLVRFLYVIFFIWKPAITIKTDRNPSTRILGQACFRCLNNKPNGLYNLADTKLKHWPINMEELYEMIIDPNIVQTNTHIHIQVARMMHKFFYMKCKYVGWVNMTDRWMLWFLYKLLYLLSLIIT